MLNSADCRSKTARAPAGSPSGEKSSRDKGLMQGHRARCRRAYETSSKMIDGQLLGTDEHTARHDALVLIVDEPLRTVESRPPLHLDLPGAIGGCWDAGLFWQEAS